MHIPAAQDFNHVLEPHGVYVKAFCFKQTGPEGDFHSDNSLATLVFSLTVEEQQVLEMESVLQQGRSGDPNCARVCVPAGLRATLPFTLGCQATTPLSRHC